MAECSKKRKRPQGVDELKFKEIWTEQYYFVADGKVPVCLLCGDRLSPGSMKQCNISRHYETRHVKNKHSACNLTGQIRKDRIISLQKT